MARNERFTRNYAETAFPQNFHNRKLDEITGILRSGLELVTEESKSKSRTLFVNL